MAGDPIVSDQTPISSATVNLTLESLSRTVVEQQRMIVEQQHTIRLLTESTHLLREDQKILREMVEHIGLTVDRLEACHCRAEVPAPAANGKIHQPVGCSAEIKVTLREVGHRLTTPGILREMSKRGYEWAESTVKQNLAFLVENGDLDNQQHTNPRGYGFPEWQ